MKQHYQHFGMEDYTEMVIKHLNEKSCRLCGEPLNNGERALLDEDVHLDCLLNGMEKEYLEDNKEESC